MNDNGQENSRVLRGAIIGFGNVALHAHLPAWQRNERFSIDVVVEPDHERAQIAKALLPQASVYREIEPALKRSDLDFVDICTPSCFHADLIEKALASGLHVLCEKPLVTSLTSLERVEPALPSERVLFTVNNWKYAPLWISAMELLRSNTVGPVRSVALTVLRPPQAGGGVTDWRRQPETAGGGILLDHGWHQLYLIRSMIKETPVAVSASMSFAGGIEETVDLSILFRAAEARLHLTWQAGKRQNHGEITGENGRILINDDHLVACCNNSSEKRHDFAEALSGASHHAAWMERVVEDFHREIRDETVRGANLAEARWCARMIHFAYQSSREGSRDVRVDDTVS